MACEENGCGAQAIDHAETASRFGGAVMRRETIQSMLRRLAGWDYRGRAIYQITVTLADRASQALGRLEVRRKRSPENGRGSSPENGRAQNAPENGRGSSPENGRGSSPENGRAQNAPENGRGSSPENGRAQDGGWVSIDEARGLGLRPEEIEARVVASEYGEAVLEALREMQRRYPQVTIIAAQLMPDHLHFIAFVRSPLDRPFGALVRGFKAGAVSRWKACSVPPRSRGGLPAPTRGGLPAPTRGGLPSWSEGFQDTVLLHEGQLANMLHYLADNARRRAIKALFPDFFKIARVIEIPLAAAGGSGAGQAAAGGSGAGQAAAAGNEHRAIGRFSALGNRFLLERPLLQVQVSRGDFGYRREPKPGGGRKICRDERGEPIVEFASPLYAEKRTALFAGARHGAVLISPCISDGERQIAREALAAGLPLIAMRNKGFAPRQKPVGRFFDACAEGRLLMLAPGAWPHVPGEKPMTRPEATAMNRLCQWIVGEDAAEINYHGMRPANIDALARQAAGVDG